MKHLIEVEGSKRQAQRGKHFYCILLLMCVLSGIGDFFEREKA